MQNFWLVLISVLGLPACAADPEGAAGSSPKSRGKFSDTKFLCDANNLELWSSLKADGTDLSGYGLVCDDGGGNTLVVRDSLIDGESGDVIVGEADSADATAVPPDSTDGNDPADNTEDTDEDVDTTDPEADELPAADVVTYTANLKVLIDGDCVSCHSAGGTPPRLDGYANAAAAGAASLASIQDNSMPIGAPWSPADKALFLEWSNAEFPE